MSRSSFDFPGSSCDGVSGCGMVGNLGFCAPAGPSPMVRTTPMMRPNTVRLATINPLSEGSNLPSFLLYVESGRVLKAARRRVFDKQGLSAVKSKAGDPTLQAGEDG